MATAKPETVKTVKIKIPRERKDQEDVFVSVNEKTWLIKRGVYVEVPEYVAKVLDNAERMREEAYEFDNAAQNASKNK